MPVIPRILPEIGPDNAFFWEAGRDGELRILRCAGCRNYVHPPAPVCPRCFERDPAPQPVSGLAVVVSYTINMKQWLPDMLEPFVVAIVELPEQAGLRLTTNIVDCDRNDVHIGMKVRVRFEQHEDVWLPLFVPA